MARVTLNEHVVKALPAPHVGNRVTFFAGAKLQGFEAPRGFGVRVTAHGARAFVMDYRIRGRKYRYTIGAYPDWPALKAVRRARDLRQRIDRGENPLDDRAPPPKTKTIADLLDDFMARYAGKKAIGDKAVYRVDFRSAGEYDRCFERLVKPRIGKLGIYAVRRSDIADMLDAIEDDSGPVMADRTLAYVRKALNWYAVRDDQFVPPIVRGMARSKARERARTRVLSDDEIRLIWPLFDSEGTFGAFAKMLLLTGQRRDEVAKMARSEIDSHSVWAIPAERYKTKRPNFVPLSKAALALVEVQTALPGCDYVFPSKVGTPFQRSGKPKIAFDKAVLAALRRHDREAEALPHWTLHDLRRTAKTLMVRAGVRPDISERVLGHVIPGVEGVYDRHHYLDEKRDALEKLAAMIKRIVNPPAENVVALEERRAGVS